MFKHEASDLAVLGGPPLFDKRLYVGRPNVGRGLRDRLLGMVREILDSRWLSNNGPMVQRFERRVAEIAGSEHCVAMCNATAGLQVAIRAARVTGEVIVPSFTFPGTAHAASWLGLTPVFCDIDPATHNIDPALIEDLITERTTGILAVHLWGRPCAVDRIGEIAERRQLSVIYDAAHALGCTTGGRPIGGLGDASVYSFHATKFVTAFEGGALVTNDAALAERARAMTNFGLTGEHEVSWPGTNAKMSEVSAAMGLASLDAMAEIVAANRDNWVGYSAGLAGLPGVTVLGFAPDEQHNYQYLVVEVDDRAPLDRDTLMRVLQAEKVMCRRYFYPGCHRLAAYPGTVSLPQTDAAAARVLQLPTGLDVGPDDVRRVCALVRFAFEHADEVRQGVATAREPAPVRG